MPRFGKFFLLLLPFDSTFEDCSGIIIFVFVFVI